LHANNEDETNPTKRHSLKRVCDRVSVPGLLVSA